MTILVIVLPITTTDRGMAEPGSRGGASGLDRPLWVMPEQRRTLLQDRLTGVADEVSIDCLGAVRTWLGDFLDL